MVSRGISHMHTHTHARRCTCTRTNNILRCQVRSRIRSRRHLSRTSKLSQCRETSGSLEHVMAVIPKECFGQMSRSSSVPCFNVINISHVHFPLDWGSTAIPGRLEHSFRCVPPVLRHITPSCIRRWRHIEGSVHVVLYACRIGRSFYVSFKRMLNKRSSRHI